MTHEQIEQREIVEAYVRGRLTEDDRKAFEDHFFGCDECFASVQNQQRFVDGVRVAAETGLLPEVRASRDGVASWFRPAFIFSTAMAVVMAVGTGWMVFVELPSLRNDVQLERERAAQKQRRESGREEKLAMSRTPPPQANLPLVMLEASRSDGANRLTVPENASQVAVWIEADPAAEYKTYRLEITAANGPSVETVEGLVRNTYGALATTLPASKMVPGTYRARLYGMGGQSPALVAEYVLEIRR